MSAVNSVLCPLFYACSVGTWDLMRVGYEVGIPPSEPTLTDLNLIRIGAGSPGSIVTTKFSQRVEGQTTGADWEWWLGGAEGWFGLRVQAKRLNVRRRRYDQLAHLDRHGRRQVDVLISDAETRQLTPIYCFYNYVLSDSLSDLMRVHGPCYQHETLESLGCTVASAYEINAAIVSNRITLRETSPFQMPWHCLVCGSAPGGGLAQRARAALQRCFNDELPTTRSELPTYVTQLMLRTGDSPYEIQPVEVSADYPVDGIAIFTEN